MYYLQRTGEDEEKYPVISPQRAPRLRLEARAEQRTGE